MDINELNLDIRDPDQMLEVNRTLLFAIGMALAAVDFDQRDKYWEYSSEEVKRLLNIHPSKE